MAPIDRAIARKRAAREAKAKRVEAAAAAAAVPAAAAPGANGQMPPVDPVKARQLAQLLRTVKSEEDMPNVIEQMSKIVDSDPVLGAMLMAEMGRAVEQQQALAAAAGADAGDVDGEVPQIAEGSSSGKAPVSKSADQAAAMADNIAELILQESEQPAKTEAQLAEDLD
ncbi:uncharacterized protein LOC62_02G003508 [Vanrija pseudolonga]|uniref:Uncharacterized protein n=1 Tax=Vanrija pseudolonga TaxID=143232 RepID=A0AAF1BHB5_9TREE|nr:hypothetical protein LOC62_02G003508 [Vanrija pseudolonga]